jgi:polyhydroxyalkanoate depolymerase
VVRAQRDHARALRHPGRLRLVYPGFLQLAAFMSMNRDRHLTALRGLYRDIAEGNAERAAKTQPFYDEYFSVLDLPAEFYLETVRSIFQEHDLAHGRLRWRDRPVDPRALRCALLTIEGEHDDISARAGHAWHRPPVRLADPRGRPRRGEDAPPPAAPPRRGAQPSSFAAAARPPGW